MMLICCEKIIKLPYDFKIFRILTNEEWRIGGDYPVNGEIIAKITPELFEILKEAYDTEIFNFSIGDCVLMNNGWT